MAKNFVLFLLLALVGTGCGLRAREEDLEKKEAALSGKEQQLLLKEKALLLKEEELLQREKKADSVQARMDTTRSLDSSFIARWNVKMTCTETGCPGSAVGDTKSETWDITYVNGGIIARAMVNNALIRTYTGSYDGSTLMLHADVPASGAIPPTRIVVRLTPSGDRTMDGQREIIRENDCRIIYNLQLSKQPLP